MKNNAEDKKKNLMENFGIIIIAICYAFVSEPGPAPGLGFF